MTFLRTALYRWYVAASGLSASPLTALRRGRTEPERTYSVDAERALASTALYVASRSRNFPPPIGVPAFVGVIRWGSGFSASHLEQLQLRTNQVLSARGSELRLKTLFPPSPDPPIGVIGKTNSKDLFLSGVWERI